MRKQSIVVFATQHMPTGGIESHLQEFCHNLYNYGVDINLVILNSCMTSETESFYRKNCRTVYFGNSGRSKWRFTWLLFVAGKLLSKSHNALYTNGQGDSVGFFSKLIRHRLWVHHHHTAGDDKDQATWSRSYIKTLLKADKVVACSTKNANQMSSSLKRSINAIPCFSQKVETLGCKQIGHKKLKFGYYGRLIPEKGIDILCKFSEDEDLRDIEFHLWGEGEHYSPLFFKKYPRLRFHGAFNGRKELISVIQSLDAYVLLSTHSEGLPISLLEAMSTGLPWLATNQGGIQDIALDELSTRVIPSSSNYYEMKLAIMSLAKDLRLGKISRSNQIKLYNTRFSASTLITSWSETLGLSKTM